MYDESTVSYCMNHTKRPVYRKFGSVQRHVEKTIFNETGINAADCQSWRWITVKLSWYLLESFLIQSSQAQIDQYDSYYVSHKISWSFWCPYVHNFLQVQASIKQTIIVFGIFNIQKR